jgi:hypothetical protein
LQTEDLLEWIKQDTRLEDLASSPRELTLMMTLQQLAARAYTTEPIKSTLLSWLVLGENNCNVSTTAHRKLVCNTRFKYDLYETILGFLKINVPVGDNKHFIRDVSDEFKKIVNYDWFNDFLKAREIALTHSFDKSGNYLWDVQREDNEVQREDNEVQREDNTDDKKCSRDMYLFLFVALSVRGRYKELKHAWQLLLSHTTTNGQPKTTYRIKQDTLIVAEAWQFLQLDQPVNPVLQQQFEQLRITLTNQLMEILEAPYLDVATYKIRKKIGRYLSHLGDPRPGVNTLLPLWKQISPDSQIHISYFPVTNAQYRTFIDEGGYNDIRWWNEFPHILNDYELGKSRACQDRYYNLSNQPVIGISWYEAIAFCRWLSYRIGYTVRLPLLNEWQEVVNQTPCDPAMSESFEPLDELVSVGCIPTVGNVVDVSGNLWEWTQDDVDTQEDGTITFAGKSQFVPYGYKMGDYQVVPRTTRGNRLGFRIVTSDE